MESAKDIAKAIAAAPELLKEIYGDLAKPGVAQAGKALATVIGLGNTMLWPFALLNEKARITLEENLERYREKVKGLSTEDVAEVPPEIGVPIAEKLTYVSNDHLRELYVQLLAQASSTKTNASAHPSFVRIIDNLSPDEALLLKDMKGIDAYPLVEVRLQEKEKNEWVVLNEALTTFGRKRGLIYPHNLPTYISNLEGLGLLQVRLDIFIAAPKVYEPLEAEARTQFGPIEAKIPNKRLAFQRGQIRITPFGRLFAAACVTDA